MNSKPLRELDAAFMVLDEQGISQPVLVFICPACTDGHSIMVGWTEPSIYPSGAVWKKTGDTVDDITITPSINCDVGPDSSCRFHGWVTNGVVTW